MSENKLGYLDNAERLAAYNVIMDGCKHLYSKGKLQNEKVEGVIKTFAMLAERDPLFLAHFTSYAMTKLEDKDMKVVSVFANILSDADGTPFSPGSEFRKPNWRIVSQAAFNMLDPKLACRVLKLANMKMQFGSKPVATHFPKSLKTAARKYVRYREMNIKAMEGIKKAGLTSKMMTMYRMLKIAPSPEAARVLRWKQGKGYPGEGVDMKKSLFDFSGLNDVQIAEKIRADKLSPLPVLGALPDKITPVIAAAILEQASGDQTVVLTEMFESQGLLKNKEVKKVYTEKLKTAKNTLDRVDRIKAKMDKEVEETLKQAKADVRKEQVGDLGKIFLHIDVSGSMHSAIQLAIDHGATIAECVKNPEENFHWGLFNGTGKALKRPEKFVKDGFAAVLYGQHAGGSTNCLALYPTARRLGCEVDVFVTDGDHTDGDVPSMIRQFREKGVPDPKQVVIIHVGNMSRKLQMGLESCGIPVTVMKPEQLRESALVGQAIKTALKGTLVVIEEILATPLLSLPRWWESVKA